MTPEEADANGPDPAYTDTPAEASDDPADWIPWIHYNPDKWTDEFKPRFVDSDEEYGNAWRLAHDEHGRLRPGMTWDPDRRPK